MVKNMPFKKRLVFISFWLVTNPLYAGFFNEKANGWHWYQEPPVVSDNNSETPESTLPKQMMTPTEIVKAYKQELEKRLHAAWVNPSAHNMIAYQTLQKDMMDRAENFSKRWMSAVYQHPALDHTLISPVNQKARHLYLDQEKKEVTSTIQALSEEYGLFFFFNSQCDYCHQFAPIVQQFSQNHGWKVIAISTDGGKIEGFNEIVNDNGLLEAWDVHLLPALFAVNPHNGHVLPIAYGMTSLDEIEIRIMALIKEAYEEHP